MIALATHLAERYDLMGPSVEAHPAGMNSRTWWVDSDCGSYVAKWVPERDRALFRAGLEAAGVVAAGGVPTGRPVKVAGAWSAPWDGGELALLERVPGTELDDEHPDAEAIIGSTLAAVHRAAVGNVAEGALEWHWVKPAGPHLSAFPDVQAHVSAAVDVVERLNGLVAGICHGDPAPEAFVVSGDGTALIDWGSPVNGPLLYDVASAAMYLGGVEAAAPMLAAYVDGGGPAAADLAHLAAMLRFRWAVQADYFATRLAAEDLTGVASNADNARGFDDARRLLVLGHWDPSGF